jgi:ribosomal protein S18 acetylase RimI-like enzyme
VETSRVEIEDVKSVSDDVVAAVERLAPQLSSSPRVPSREEIAEIIDSPATRLLVARRRNSDIVGTLTLALFRIPTGIRAWIEDVIVDEAVRGQGVGEALVQEALRLGSAAGARTVDLTSRPGRDAANRLYEKLGFERRDTNVYRFTREA